MSSPPRAERAAIVSERSTAARTLGSLDVRAAERLGHGAAPVDRAAGEAISYVEPGVPKIAGGLVELGVAPDDWVAIMFNTRAEWTLADLGALSAGATVEPIYQTGSPDRCQHVLAHSDVSDRLSTLTTTTRSSTASMHNPVLWCRPDPPRSAWIRLPRPGHVIGSADR